MPLRRTLALTFAALALGPVAAQEPPLATAHLNFDAFREGFGDTLLGRLWEEPLLQPSRRTISGALRRLYPDLDFTALPGLLEGQAVLVMTRHVAELGQSGRMAWAAGFAEASEPAALLEPVQALAGTVLPEEVVLRDELLIVGNDGALRQRLETGLLDDLDREDGPGGEAPFFRLRIDRGAFGDLEALALSQVTQVPWVPLLALDEVSGFDLALTFAGDGMTVTGTMAMANPEASLIGLLGPSAPFTFLDLAPESTILALAAHHAPPEEIWDFAVGALSAPVAASLVGPITGRSGLDLRAQALSAFGRESAVILDPRGEVALAGLGVILRVRDAAVADQFLEEVTRRLARRTAGPLGPAGFPVSAWPPPEAVSEGDVEYAVRRVGQFDVCWGIVAERMVVALSRDLMGRIIATAEGGPSLRESEDFQAMAAVTGRDGAVMTHRARGAIADPQATRRWIRQMSAGGDQTALLPRLAGLAVTCAYLSPAASRIHTGPSGLTFTAHSLAGFDLATLPTLAASFALPNALQAWSRGRLTRARDAMRSIATALEAYHLDRQRWPLSVPGSAPDSVAAGHPLLAPMPTFSLRDSLSTPVAYIDELLEDPFTRGSTFSYHTDGTGWILVSPGPDGDFDLQPEEDYRGHERQPAAALLRLAFDPTNGATSSGDLFRVRQ